MSSLTHPLALNKSVTANKPTCQCRGGRMVQVKGKILKVINNHSGIWYYLDCGSTVKADWVTSVS